MRTIPNPFTGIDYNAQIDGLFFTYRIKMHYENTTSRDLEIHYSFPLKEGAVVTAFSTTINGVTKKAEAKTIKQAHKKYEDAIEQGDAPVMLEKGADGILRADIGNLKPNEKADIELSVAQLLTIYAQEVQIVIPAAVGERYGNAPCGRDAIGRNLFAQYKVTGSFQINGFLAKGRISSPTHMISQQSVNDGILITLPDDALLDKDITVNISGVEGSQCIYAYDSVKEGYVSCVSFCTPNIIAAKDRHLNLSILVDCSGSMQGERIYQAKQTVCKLLNKLEENDVFTVSRFGSRCENITAEPMHAVQSNVTRISDLIKNIDADLGGTELAKAISNVADLDTLDSGPRDVLILTDGDVWQADEIIKMVKKYRLRLFIIGIGLNQGDYALTNLADVTGGVYRSIHNPNEIEDAVLLMHKLMKSALYTRPKLKLNAGNIDYVSKLPKSMFQGSGINVLAHSSQKPEMMPELCTKEGTLIPQSICEIKGEYADSLIRLAAMSRISESTRKVSEDLALSYNLMSDYTNFILVHERTCDNKAGSCPDIFVVPQMVSFDAIEFSGSCNYKSAPKMSYLSEPFELYSDIDSSITGSRKSSISKAAGRLSRHKKSNENSGKSNDSLSSKLLCKITQCIENAGEDLSDINVWFNNVAINWFGLGPSSCVVKLNCDEASYLLGDVNETSSSHMFALARYLLIELSKIDSPDKKTKSWIRALTKYINTSHKTSESSNAHSEGSGYFEITLGDDGSVSIQFHP